MKRFILVLVLLLGVAPVFAQDDFKNVGIAKYAVLKVLNNNTPLRESPSESAKRLTHLFQDTLLFANSENTNYFRIELDEDNFSYINKKNVEVQGIIPEKRFDRIKKLTLDNDKKRYSIKIETDEISSYIIKENQKGFDFTLYDNHYDPIEAKVDYRAFDKSGVFNIPRQISNELKINYTNNFPLFGYDLEKTEKGYNLLVKKAPKINQKRPLKNIAIVVDPGHGGSEKGACAFDLEEKKINLEISKKLKKELTKQGAKVYLTRTKDKKTGLYERVEFAKTKNADILLSIHQNSLANKKDVEKKHGVGTYYYHNQSRPLAESIQKELLVETEFKDDKVNFASFALTRPTAQISVLVECGYIIYEPEAKLISDKKFQKKIAKAITKGVENYLSQNF